MRKLPKPKMPSLKVKEHDTQLAIVQAIQLAGLVVRESTAYTQKGATGVDKGLPDLWIVHPTQPWTWMGMEVKPPGDIVWSSIEQEQAAKAHHFPVVQSVESALTSLRAWLCEINMPDQIRRNSIWKIDNVLRGLQ